LAIFPEGISHDLPEVPTFHLSSLPLLLSSPLSPPKLLTNRKVHELKTGFARAALQAIREKNSDDYEVTIIPVGLNFMDKDRFRRLGEGWREREGEREKGEREGEERGEKRRGEERGERGEKERGEREKEREGEREGERRRERRREETEERRERETNSAQ
jgi:hypothetical protein